MRPWLPLLVSAALLATAGATTPAAAQAGNAIIRSQTNRTVGAIQNQIRQAVRPQLAVRNPAGAVESLSLSTDGKLLAIMLADNSIRLFDLQTGTQRIRLSGGANRFRAVAIDADNRFVVTGGADGTVTVWDGATGARLRVMERHEGAVNALVITPDGSAAASGGADGKVRLWSLATGQGLGILSGHTGAVLSLAISPDGARIVSGGADGRAVMWSRADGSVIATLGGQSDGVVAVGFDSAGRVVTTDGTGSVRVWAPNSASPARTFRSAQGAAGAQVTADGRYVVLGAAGGRASLHDIDSGQLVKEFSGPSGSARYMLVDVKRQRLLMGGADGMVRVLNLSDGANLAQIVSTLNGWAVLDTQGRFDGSQQGVTDVEWIANQAELPIDNFSQNYYEPGLLAKHFAAQPIFVAEAASPVSEGIFQPPQSRIALSPGPYLAGQTVVVTVTTEDRQGGIGEVRLFQNGKLVPRESITAERNETRNNVPTRETVYRVQLVAGATRFEALAGSDQRIDGAPTFADVTATGARPLPTLHIVTIGINKYRDSRLDLDYGAPDALAILATLGQSTATLFDKVVEYRLLDDAASRSNILALLKTLRLARPDDEVVIFYAGHGTIHGKEWYLVPYDVAMASEQDQIRSSVSASELRDAVVHIGAERILIFVDACRSGGSVETLASAMDRKVLRELAREAGVGILAASRPDQLAAELPSLGHGAFTYVVLQGLAGRADREPADGRITVSKLLNYSLETLPTVTEKLGILPQVPMAYRRGSDFVVKTSVGG